MKYCLCVCVWAYLHMYFALVCVLMWRPEPFLIAFLPYFLRQSVIGLELAGLARLAHYWAQEIYVSSVSSARVTNGHICV